MTNRNILNKIGQSIHRKDPSAEAFLFGSRARGDNRKDSDWDILILVDNKKITNDVEDFFRDELYDIELETGQAISAFIYSKDDWKGSLTFTSLYKNVIREGVRL